MKTRPSTRKPRRDRTGEKYGRLTVTGYADYDERNKRHRWWVRCSCPKHRVFKTPTTNLTSGRTKGCGCLNGSHRVINLMGEVFGHLTVTGRGPARPRPGARWICLCQCGNVTDVDGCELRIGSTRSCGCMQHQWHSIQSPLHAESPAT